MTGSTDQFDEPIDPLERMFRDVIHRYEMSLDSNPLDANELIRQYPEIADKLNRYFQGRHGLEAAVKRKESFQLAHTDRYRIVETIGQGGMGSIVKVMDRHFDREAALKVPLKDIAADPKMLARLDREARLSGRLQHPNIVPIFERGNIHSIDGKQLPFFAMRFLEGQTLQDKLTARSNLKDEQFEFVLLFRQVCQAVAYAHSCNIIHRDLKPHNVMIGNFGDAYVLDWGVAKDISSNPLQPKESKNSNTESIATDDQDPLDETITMMLSKTDPTTSESKDQTQIQNDDGTKEVGTPDFLPPEMLNERVKNDKRLDVFCLGGILCSILTGKPTFLGTIIQKIVQIRACDVSDAMRRLDACAASPELISIAKQCLAPNMDDRPGDAAAVVQLVSQYIENQEQAKLRAEQDAVAQAQGRAIAEKRLRNLSIGVSAIILASVIFFMYQRQKGILDQSRRETYQAGIRSLHAGDLDAAQTQFEAAIAMGNASLQFRIKRLRALLPKQDRDASIAEAEKLFEIAQDPADQAELQWLLGDLESCDRDTMPQGKLHLEQSIASGLLSLADQQYAMAILAKTNMECEKHLTLAIESERFHYRACMLRPSILLSLGRMREAERTAELLQSIYPRERPLSVVLETCRRLRTDDPANLELPKSYTSRLDDLQSAFASKVNDNPEPGAEQLTFARQAVVATRAARLVRELPAVSDTPGLPRQPFDERARHWTRLAGIAGKLGPPQDVVSAAFQLGINRTELIKELESIAEHDTDGLALQILAVAKFVDMAGKYNSIGLEEKNIGMASIELLQTRSIERETLAPRSQFEIASRVVRVLCDYHFSRIAKQDSEFREKRMRSDLDWIVIHVHKYPAFLNNVCEVLLGTFVLEKEQEMEAYRVDDLAIALQIANLWTKHSPTNVKAKLRRASLLHEIGQINESLSDIHAVLAIEPTNESALQLKEKLGQEVSEANLQPSE